METDRLYQQDNTYDSTSRGSATNTRRAHSKLVSVASAVALVCTGAMFGAMVVLVSQNPDGSYGGEHAMTNARASGKPQLPWYSQTKLPKKVAVDGITPRKTQDNRGTCWDFATIGILEQSYRANGIEKGWLKADEYVAFSEQAYGKVMIDACRGPKSSPQQKVCRVPGDQVAANSTEGGEVPYLYYLADLIDDAVLPHAVCPYVPSAGASDVFGGTGTLDDADGGADTCDGIEEALATNPLFFRIDEMRTMYESMEIKAELVSTQAGRAMAFSTAVPLLNNYLPCVGKLAATEACDPMSPRCHPCPAYYSPTACCVNVGNSPPYTLDGEFTSTPQLSVGGGHAMLLVGYNDNFRTADGQTGGFIIKNSWWDGANPPLGPPVVRGSHSVDWWMQEISDWDERKVCPNSYHPNNWYQCGNSLEVKMATSSSGAAMAAAASVRSGGDAGGGVGGATSATSTASADPVLEQMFADCTSADTRSFAKLNIQPLHLHCIDGGVCDDRPSTMYYAKNMSTWGDGFTVMCFFQHDTAAAADTVALSDLCLPPMRKRNIPQYIRPVASEVGVNDPDRCGFYFMPYEVVNNYVVNFQGFFVNSFEIRWHPRSYLANAALYGGINYADDDKNAVPLGSDPFYTPSRVNMADVKAEEAAFHAAKGYGVSKTVAKAVAGGDQVFDYNLIRASTKHQRTYNFTGPFPNAKVVI